MKDYVFCLVVALLYTSALTVALKVQPFNASGPIYIRADGSIDPPDAPVSTFDKVTYTLTANTISDSDGIVVERDNTIVDGSGFTVEGPGAFPSQGVPSHATLGIYLHETSNVTIKNTVIENFSCGFELEYSDNNSILGNNITSHYCGISLSRSSHNKLNENNIFGYDKTHVDSSFGIGLDSSILNMISDNTVTNSGTGIWVRESPDSTVANNTLTANARAMTIQDNWHITISGNNVTRNTDWAVILSAANNCTVSGNNIESNQYGIMLKLDTDYGRGPSRYNTISDNNIAENGFGINVYESSYNSIFHNNFVANTPQIESVNSNNTWDDAYPSGGNYWSNYNGTDTRSGLHQLGPGSDGIGDTPMVLDGDNVDRYPLMNQLVTPSSSMRVSIYPTSTSVFIGSNVTITMSASDVVNLFSWQVAIKYNASVMTCTEAWLPEDNIFTGQVTFSGPPTLNGMTLDGLNYSLWGVSLLDGSVSFAQGTLFNMNFTVVGAGETALTIGTRRSPIYVGWPGVPVVQTWHSFLQDPDLNEIPLTETNGFIHARALLGDINSDGVVDMKDISYVARRFLCLQSDPLWDPVADVNADNKIDMKDISTVARHFGEHHQ